MQRRAWAKAAKSKWTTLVAGFSQRLGRWRDGFQGGRLQWF